MKKLESKVFIDQLSRLFGNWPIDEKRVSAISKEYLDVFHEVGQTRFERGTSAIIQESALQFFPTVAEFRGYIPQAGKVRWCGKCDEGFVMRPDYEARRQYGNAVVMKAFPCECRGGVEHLRRLKTKPTYSPEWEPPFVDFELRRQRDEHPEEFFGVAEVAAMMSIARDRKAKGLGKLSDDGMIEAVLEVRRACQESRIAAEVKSDKRKAGKFECAADIMARLPLRAG